jgi:hypothetical protein
MKLITYLHLEPKLRMSGCIPPLAILFMAKTELFSFEINRGESSVSNSGRFNQEKDIRYPLDSGRCKDRRADQDTMEKKIYYCRKI